MYMRKIRHILIPALVILMAVLLLGFTQADALAAPAGTEALSGPVIGPSTADWGGAADPGIDPGPAKKSIHVSKIGFLVTEFKIGAVVQILDQSGNPVADATVGAVWTLPDGSRQKLVGTTRSSGYTVLTVRSERGKHTIKIEDVSADGYVFNAAASQLNASIKID